MISNSEFGNISFDLPKNQSNVIKVIGVGGGGSNAINHMFKQGIKGVDFIVCNTDSQALQNSAVPNKIQLGVNLTEGLGAGANPDVGQQSAIESIADIEKMLDTNTKMVFITAGMGGGTGTGAAPVIAQLAKERDILTVGIVTIPFQFEGKVRSDQALQGVERLRKQVDSLIVINNNKLREVYGNLGFKAGFSKADEVLATASRGIAEVITHHYTQNIDLKDAKTVLSNSGTAIMGSSVASGENRAKEAIISALDSPLLNDNKITGAKNVLLLIVSGTSEITIDEIGEINDHIQAEAGYNANIIMGVGEDETLGESIAVTIIATGFNVEQQNEIVNTEPKKIIHSLEDDQKLVRDLSQKPVDVFQSKVESPVEEKEEKIVFELIEDDFETTSPVVNEDENELIAMTQFIKNLDVTFEIVSPIKDIDFRITTPEVKEINVVEPQTISKEEEQITFTFEAQTEMKSEAEETKIVFDLSDETKNIEVNEPVQFVPVTELNEEGIIKYSLEEYMELENDLLNSKPAANAKVEEPIDEALDITMKDVTETKTSTFTPSFEDVSPIEMTIEETLKMRADERRRKLKEFNYKFHNNPSRVDELEKEPAYKRSGIDLNENQPSNSASRLSLGTDSNNDNQLRSNNSFLHDNVD
ncbi:cell division protein FtsZ [Flavobacterium capsici]|uniref:Cell division protein FtsZ n=1 Tax=Flavobacterium capsici TaxID=3075618 RepID=A0AA96EXT1_9FLAO|nr:MULTISPECIES: cell division protein FtsZ [unclassified Flavobacterium]WNM19179.1 cell division protein FtsZ [Flavobacterium sp. PMR2A8]WNM20568.1 cell division protein FtsZ [Flavobacterium sp. PMTSA4]